MTYTVEKGLINSLIVSCITAIVVIGAYMVSWNSDDKAWKRGVDVTLIGMAEDIAIVSGKLEALADKQILPEAKWKIQSIERWMNEHESIHHSVKK